MLGFLKAETAQVPKGSALAAFVFSEPGLARIFDDGELVFAGDGVYRVHVARKAVNVDRHNGSRAVGDPALDGSRIHGECGRIGVGKYREGIAVQDSVVGGNER